MNQRFYSLDVFRGATVALMILVNNPGSWSYLYPPLAHASWHGCTPTDLVFPFFLFAVGNAMAFVMPRLEAAGTNVFLKKVFKRSILIFAIGLFLNWCPFVKWSDSGLVFRHWTDPNNPESGVRILGVLQRIALCYLFASLIIYFFKIRGAYVISVIILLGYWMLTMLLGTPGDPYSLSGYFGTNIDKAILGAAHMYKGEGVAFDPEGLTSTLPAIVQVIFGYMVGHYIQQKGKTHEMLSGLFVIGSVLVFTGFVWDMAFPINKKIWTSSYVLYTTGLGTMVLSVLIYLIEFKEAKGAWSRFFDVFGKNALFVFALSGFLVKVLPLFRWIDHVNEQGKPVYTSPLNWFYEHVCSPLLAFTNNPKNGSFLYAVCLLAVYWLIARWMDKKKIYIKV
ncbi:DUF1624 domain-containing protein [Pseudoflavitalea sp. G-6-1-2]|uniref:acyltransferase family protein n=1 Tax=Pseudoflavitalea sp. G-6-1-2 TaxID=2728841 RepID=UPI00146DA99C|nr:DUF5009 domain-containing protein [Pseudoflavitalea sp. G-6-1-2]NML19620.1 DUF1624 domain-containing protein [Pseudoflavitalea sp. G-6-1-2]